MSNVFGIANHSPDRVIEVLGKMGVIAKPSAVTILPEGSNLKSAPKHKIILMLSVRDLMRNLRAVNGQDFKDHKFVVFDSPMQLGDVTGVLPIDYAPDPQHRAHGYMMMPLKRSSLSVLSKPTKKTSVPIKRDGEEFVMRLINTVTKGSLLNPLMTFIYTLPSSTHQGPIKKTVAKWLYSGKPISNLFEELDALKEIQVTPRIKERFRDLLDTEIGRNFQAAFSDYRKALRVNREVSVGPICKQNQVDPYEVRYLLSVIADKAKPAAKPTVLNFKRVTARKTH